MADTSLFGRLRRLFSSNVIVRNVGGKKLRIADTCLLYTSPSPRDAHESRMPSSA